MKAKQLKELQASLSDAQMLNAHRCCDDKLRECLAEIRRLKKQVREEQNKFAWLRRYAVFNKGAKAVIEHGISKQFYKIK